MQDTTDASNIVNIIRRDLRKIADWSQPDNPPHIHKKLIVRLTNDTVSVAELINRTKAQLTPELTADLKRAAANYLPERCQRPVGFSVHHDSLAAAWRWLCTFSDWAFKLELIEQPMPRDPLELKPFWESVDVDAWWIRRER
jgi:hypothetical protein